MSDTPKRINDGGPAFPFTPNPQPQNNDGTWVQQWDAGEPGMTLRDYFAAKAMIGILAGDDIQLDGNHNLTPHAVAVLAYRIADAMIAARNEGGAA